MNVVFRGKGTLKIGFGGVSRRTVGVDLVSVIRTPQQGWASTYLVVDVDVYGLQVTKVSKFTTIDFGLS